MDIPELSGRTVFHAASDVLRTSTYDRQHGSNLPSSSRDRSPLSDDYETSFRRNRTNWDPRTIGLCANVSVDSGVAVQRLLKELDDLKRDGSARYHAAPKGDNLFEWAAVIEGPEDTVYNGGTFFLELSIPKNYPFFPPRVRFLTRIYHCNINTQGVVCVDVLRNGWNSSMTISTVLQSIVSLMYVCNPADPLVSGIAEQYISNREEFERTARIWTERYAR